MRRQEEQHKEKTTRAATKEITKWQRMRRDVYKRQTQPLVNDLSIEMSNVTYKETDTRCNPLIYE